MLIYPEQLAGLHLEEAEKSGDAFIKLSFAVDLETDMKKFLSDKDGQNREPATIRCILFSVISSAMESYILCIARIASTS